MSLFKSIILWLSTSGIKIVGILIGLLIIYQMSKWITRWVERFIPERDIIGATEAKKRAYTLGNILRHALLILVSLIAIMMVLGELGVQLGPLLATAGIGALAIGFGAQSLVKDVISGFFIILENQYRIGDVIKVGSVSGLVEQLSLRRTVLRDLEGVVHTIPNGEIKIVSNLSKEWSRCVIDVEVSYNEDIDKVIDLLIEIGKSLEKEEPYKDFILEPIQILGVERFGESGIVIRMMIKTAPLKQWEIGRELRKRIKKCFDEKGIQIPYPHRVLIFGEKRRNQALKELITGKKG